MGRGGWRRCRSKTSMYHALGHCTVHFMKAMMTCEPLDVERAVEHCKEAVAVAAAARRPASIFPDSMSRLLLVKTGSTGSGRSSPKPFGSLSEVEMHAELCYAESLLQRALLSFIQDDSLGAFVKGALRIRQCYNSYQECQRLLDATDWADKDPALRLHFHSGVCMGLGTFNLLIASLPARVLRLLEFVGFTGDKRLGLRSASSPSFPVPSLLWEESEWWRLLERGAGMRESLRAPLCSLILLTWHLVAVYLFGTSHGDLKVPLSPPIVHVWTTPFPSSSAKDSSPRSCQRTPRARSCSTSSAGSTSYGLAFVD